MGKSAVTNVQGVTMARNQDELSSSMQDICLHQGDSITIDGSTGTVYMGAMPTIAAGRDEYFQTIMQWADKYKRRVETLHTMLENVAKAGMVAPMDGANIFEHVFREGNGYTDGLARMARTTGPTRRPQRRGRPPPPSPTTTAFRMSPTTAALNPKP
jgi:hypothetical protein